MSNSDITACVTTADVGAEGSVTYPIYGDVLYAVANQRTCLRIFIGNRVLFVELETTVIHY